MCGVCHSPLPFMNPHRSPERPDRTLWEKARVESHPARLGIKTPKGLHASIHEMNSCIDQPPDCQRGDGFPEGSRPWRLARGRGRLEDGPAPRPGGEGGRLRITTSARRISTPGGRRLSRSIVAPRPAVQDEGSRADSARGRVSRRHLNRGRGPLQEGRAFSNLELVNPQGGTAYGPRLETRGRRPWPVVRSEGRLAATLVVPSRGRFSKYP